MRAHFHIEFRPDSRGEVVPTEYVTIHTGRDGKDEVSRRATEFDRSVFADAYAAFTKPGKASNLEPEERLWSAGDTVLVTEPVVPPEDDEEKLAAASKKHHRKK